MLLISIFVCSLLNFLTPMIASRGGWQSLIVLRVVEGFCQGVIFPSAHTLLSKWAPPSERGRIGTYTYAGAQFGTVAMLAISGILASSSMGWPSIFYFSGGSGLIWSALWLLFGASSPADCKTISMEERSFIEKSLKTNEDDAEEVRIL